MEKIIQSSRAGCNPVASGANLHWLEMTPWTSSTRGESSGHPFFA